MRLLPITIPLAVLLPLAVQAGPVTSPALSADQCGVATDYNVLVDGGGIWLRRDVLPMREIVFHDGQLSIDNQMQAVSAQDAQRLRALEHGVRQLMPAVTGIANESVGISFDTLDAVYEGLTGNANSRKVRKLRKEAERFVEQTIGRGRWEQDLFNEDFEARVQDAAESLSGSIARSMLWVVFTGGEDKLDARADKLDAELEQRLQHRTHALEQHAQSLCAQVQVLDRLQSALEFRLNGQPLQMMRVTGDTATMATREHMQDNSIPLPPR
ncbi:DUF2884 family protein [Stenotrophomonas sp. Iso1]|uniref:DUF2884 family protein n=1 Tax=Stenotrophomonas sp. Iso1 TaxID=2977283 RepID=UPI0022B7D2CB|nr:DUF2884 family protein [Stenotrophomonas sp. Iso1]